MKPEEYLFKRKDGEWFDLDCKEIEDILKPIDIPSETVEGWGTHRIVVDGIEISFSNEIAGIQVCFESGELTFEREKEIIYKIAKNIEDKLRQQVEIIDIYY